MSKIQKTFTFVVLTYNHEEYIIEHLESIKFLIENYAFDMGICINIIVNDDCSKDSTPSMVSEWLDKNKSLFNKIIKIFNEKNLGTCQSLLNCLDCVESDYLKITAGDDVYSYENIFQYGSLEDNCAMLSGFPLSLVDGVISECKRDTIHILASQVIYQNMPLIKRFSFLSNNNAPNIFYNKNILMQKDVLKNLSKFDVVEDWPIQIMIALKCPNYKFHLVNKVFVYYRRTNGSSYIVANSRFYKDKLKCFDFLISQVNSKPEKLFLVNRRFVFGLKKPIISRLINISLYKYIFAFIKRAPVIFYKYIKIDYNIKKHRHHYSNIKLAANNFLSRCDFDNP